MKTHRALYTEENGSDSNVRIEQPLRDVMDHAVVIMTEVS